MFNFLKKEKTQKQILKFSYTTILCLALLLIVELIFQIPAVKDFFGAESLSNNMSNNTLIWVILWLLMFAQVTIIPIPAMPIYVFCNNTSLVANGTGILDLFSLKTLFFTVFVVSACLAGAVVAYFLGKLFGGRAVKWIAGDEEEYNQWSQKLNCKLGKYTYAFTVLFPIFPDDILCLVVGALGMDFGFFTLSNLIGKFIGAFCMLVFLRVPYLCDFFQSSVNGGFPWALLVYFVLLIICVIFTMILKKKITLKSCIDSIQEKNF